MAVLRQEEILETGRVNQKRRTRTAIINGARELLESGVTPTVAQAAEAALVSRTTAYRYFPSQESLLVDIAVNADVGGIEELVAAPAEPGRERERVLEVLEMLSRQVFSQEVRYRTVERLYLDMWLTASANGDDAPVVREGRRRRWLLASLAPLRDTVPSAEINRLVAALSLTTGTEAMMVLRDVCHLDAEQGIEVTQWAARALLNAALGDADHESGPRSP
ncbi:MAG TPA: TetR/AcrR family transcriptional regulator [Acidimicrobiales bacterium]|nr:TetR/AcrR family transcriptional regulator [Acidimicrobiales bacterium]